MREFKRVLVANRGEIALRIIRALKTLEIESVGIFSDADFSALHVAEADKAFRIPGVYPKDTYLNLSEILEIARKSDSDAIHPGYGFQSENTEFSRLCRKNSIKFIGPSPETLLTSGNKLECKKIANSIGVPVVPYTKEPVEDVTHAQRCAKEIGYPVLLKSAFGGGGRGIKEAKSKEDVAEAFESSKREAEGSFGRFAVYIEKEVVQPRHIEIQIIADDDSANIVHLGERDCSIQRRYQKLVEVSPSPVVDEEIRERLANSAISIAKAVKYSNAGTVEFLRDSTSGEFYFLEINSRLQVEHPVSELVTGIDIVSSQIEIASRKKLPFKQKDILMKGTAIECRINSEDALSDFMPSSGTIEFLKIPSGPGIRVDTALYEGLEITPYYDSLLAKLVSWGSNYEGARRRMLVALDEFKLVGLKSNISFHRSVMENKEFAKGNFNTSFITENNIIQKLSKEVQSNGLDRFAVAAFLLSKNQIASAPEHEKPVRRISQVAERKGRFIDGL
jgi:acetyl-CoA/propionyl-CoA carboxylase